MKGEGRRAEGERPPARVLAVRVLANDEWLKRSVNLHREECARIGAWAKEQRMARGKGLREVARAMGISAPMLVDLERGTRLWTSKTVEAWEGVMR